MAKELSPIEIYQLLPRTDCKECGEENCMAFAAKLVTREAKLRLCTPLTDAKYKKQYDKLRDLLRPPVHEITIGVRPSTIKVGGELVMYRHDFTYFNPTAIAIDVTDEMEEALIKDRVSYTETFSYTYLGKPLKLDLIAIRSTSGDPEKFQHTVKSVMDKTTLPFILCTFNPEVIEAGLKISSERKPMLYAATRNNWQQMAELALKYQCPLAVFSPNNLDMLRSLVKTLTTYGVEDLLLDPGTYPNEGLTDTLNAFTALRWKGCKERDELSGYPLIGVPLVAWTQEGKDEIAKAWQETYISGMLIARYADLLILHGTSGWSLLPQVFLRENIYTDPRKPVSVEAGLRTVGKPSADSPMMFTTNFALTYYTVMSDLEGAGIDCYLLVVDTEGLSVDSAVAGRKLTADGVAEALKEVNAEDKVKYKALIIPGRSTRLSGEIQETAGWKVLVGPMESSQIPKYLSQNWPPKMDED